MVGFIRRAAYAAAALFCAFAVSAQGLRDRDRVFEAGRTIAEELRRARLHIGNFYLLSTIQLGDIGYDQQYFVPTADTEAGGGVSFSVSAPTRLYYVPHKKTIFSVEVSPQYTRFQRANEGRGTLGYLSRGDAQFILNHLYFDVYATQSHLLRADTGEIARMVDAVQKQHGVSGELRYSSRTSLKFSASTGRLDYPRNDKQPAEFDLPLLNRSDHSYRVAAQHQTFPLTQIVLAGEWANYSFDNAAYANATRTYEGAGIIFDNGLTLVRAEAGPAKLDFKREGQKDFTGLVGNAALTRRHTRLWHSTMNAQRDTNFSLFVNNNYFIADRVGVTTEFEVTRHLSLDATATLGWDRYEVAAIPPLEPGLGPTLRRDQIRWTAVGWTYGLRRFRGGFDVGYVSRTSNFKLDEQDGIRVVFRLSLTP